MDISAAGLAVLAVAAGAGAALQAATGFGFAIVAAPVFLIVLQSATAVPILIALHVVQSIVLVPRIWRTIPWREFNRLAVGAIVGCPLGLLIFQYLDVRQLKLGVGIVILCATVLFLGRRLRRETATATPPAPRPQAQIRWQRIATGALSGALTAALVMPGPPLMISLLRDPLPAMTARSLSVGLFAACYVGVLIAQAATGEFDDAARSIVAWLAGPVVLGTIIGVFGARWLTDRVFAPLMTVLLLAASAGAIISAL